MEAVRAERPDVLLTDLGMPGLSGWDVAREARARWPDLPVLLLTGWGRDVSPAQLREHGVLLALAKPAELPALRAALARALRPAPAAPPGDPAGGRRRAFATVLGVLLGQGGHRGHAASSGRAAVEALAGTAPVDLVILDLNLPDRPSVEVLRAARARPRGPAVCVVQRQRPGVDGDGRAGGRPVRGEGLRAGAAGAHLRPRPRPARGVRLTGPGGSVSNRVAWRFAGTARGRYAAPAWHPRRASLPGIRRAPAAR